MTSSEQRHQRGKGGGGNKGFKEESELGRERTFFPSEDQKAGQAHPWESPRYVQEETEGLSWVVSIISGKYKARWFGACKEATRSSLIHSVTIN